eukprot:6214132-Pleurochrysis_carterae.AAC.6
MGIAEWADIYDKTTKEYYTTGDLCQKYGNVQQTEHGALGIIWESRHKGDILGVQAETQEKERINKILGVIEKGQTAESVLGGGNT